MMRPKRILIGLARAPGRRKVPRRARCTRWRQVVILRQREAVGPSHLHFSGRVGAKRLVPGRYRATAWAADSVGNGSRPKSLRLRVVAPVDQR